MKKVKYDILSPDGISIYGDSYPSAEMANKKFDEWAKHFEFQGYYSSNRGRIPLNELRDYCRLIEV